MLCNICKKNQATVHLTEIVDDQMTELHLCDECAKKKSVQMEQQFGLSDLLGGLVDYTKQIGGGQEKPSGIQCPSCGLTYEDFRKIGRLGCSECYSAFSRYLGPLLKRIHGATQHVGKSPSGWKAVEHPVSAAAPASEGSTKRPRTASLAELKIKLQQAIEAEEFEEAAKLRDAIKEAEKKKKGKTEE